MELLLLLLALLSLTDRAAMDEGTLAADELATVGFGGGGGGGVSSGACCLGAGCGGAVAAEAKAELIAEMDAMKISWAGFAASCAQPVTDETSHRPATPPVSAGLLRL